MFHYDVLTEEEALAERFQLLKDGIYDAVITASIDTQSKTGNAMMDITVSVFDENGRPHDVRDFLVFTKPMMWKIVHFADSAGILKEYESGTLCSEIAISKSVKVKISIESGNEIPEDKLNGKPLGSRYHNKNKIEDYIKKDDQHSKSKEEKSTYDTSSTIDDDIPF